MIGSNRECCVTQKLIRQLLVQLSGGILVILLHAVPSTSNSGMCKAEISHVNHIFIYSIFRHFKRCKIKYPKIDIYYLFCSAKSGTGLNPFS